MYTRYVLGRARLAGILALILLLAVASAAQAAPGDLDPSFDGDGRTTVDFGGFDGANALVLDGSGHIVLAGFTDNAMGDFDFAAARLLGANGMPDVSFGGGDGLATVDFSSGDEAFALALDGNGRIVLAGSAHIGGNFDFAVARLNADGTPDPTFGGGDGRVAVNFGGSDIAYALALDRDSRIVLAGYTDTAGNYDFAVARLDAGGTLDTTFSDDGRATVDIGGDDAAYALALDGDGRIVLAGTTDAEGNYDFAVARLNANGSPDPTFGGDGIAKVDFGGRDLAYALALDNSSHIVLAGATNAGPGGFLDFGVARLQGADGTLDTTFGGGDGRTALDFGGADYARALAVDRTGHIIVAGTNGAGGYSDFAVGRLLGNGAPDPTFGGDGLVTVDFSGGSDGDFALALALDGSGRIVAGGHTNPGGVNDFAVARLLGDGPMLKTYLPLVVR